MADGEQQGFDLGALAQQLRPSLHRYCARMLGSALEGEDIVQETLARAAGAKGGGIEHPERWLFRIARNAALDALRRTRRETARRSDALDPETLADRASSTDSHVAVTAGLAHFLRLTPAQRSVVILADVLGHSLAEIVAMLDMTPAAAKAALHRGRLRLRGAQPPADPAPLSDPDRERLRAYADRFNAGDFDALRALLAQDVRLDLVDRTRLEGAAQVGVYFTRYSELADPRARPVLAEGRSALLVSVPGGPDYVVLLEWRDGAIAAIRDFRYATYVMEAIPWREDLD